MTMSPKRQPPPDPAAIDESAESEITILPDGRVCAFGITRTVAELLAAIPTSDKRTQRLLNRIRVPDATIAPDRSDG